MKKILLIMMAVMVITLITTVANAADRYAVANGNWNSTTTWSTSEAGAPGASVPIAGDNVFIPSGRNVTVTANAACSNLTFTIIIGSLSGGTFTVNSGFTLNVSGSITKNNETQTSSTTTITGAGTINCAAFIVGGTNTTINGNHTITLTSTIATISISGNLSLRSETQGGNDGNVVFNLASGNIIVGGTVNTDEEAGSSVTLSLDNGAETGTLTLTGATPFTNTVGTLAVDFNGTGATVDYAAAGAQTILAATYTNLVASGSGAKTITGSTVDGTLSMQGTATVAGTSPSYGANAILEYEGSAAQTTSNVEFPTAMTADLVINNAAGVTLNATKNLNASLTLTNGILTTSGAALLNFPNNFTTVNGGSTSSYVSGPVRKTGNDAFTFPVGKAGIYSPVTISGPDNNADAFTCEYKRESATALGAIAVAGIFRVSNCEYWELTETNDAGGANSISVTVGWNSNSGCGPLPYITDYTNIRLLHFNGSVWNEIAGTTGNPTGNNTTGSITRTAVTNFSPFALGSSLDDGNPLPVTFADVKAFEKGSGVQIEWSNLTEKDVVNYIVERSANGNDFTAIGQLNARSNQTDKQSYVSLDAAPIAGTNFYRIKVVELDGKIIYSKMLRVDIGKTVKGISLYPNPVTSGEVTIGFTAVKGLYTLRIMNAAGQQVSSKQIVHPGGNVSQAVTVPASVKAGFYVMMISGENFKESKTFVIQ